MSGPPPAELMDAILALGAEASAAGALLDTAGLAPSAFGGARVALADGDITVTDGPFAETKELISYALYQVRDKAEAVEWAARFLRLHRDMWPGWQGEADLRQVSTEPPGGWLALTARNRAIDVLRRRAVHDRKAAEVGRGLADVPGADAAAEALDDPVGDDLLRLIFISCHPALRPEGRAALTLRLLGGLGTEEIARAFLISQAAAGQRVVRAKRTLADRRIPYELPTAEDLPARLRSVLGVLYLIFNEGYSATAGADWTRPSLCEEAMRLARVLAARLPAEPETHGLQALIELHASRLPARTGPDGSPVLLADQDRRRWDRLLIRRGMAALERAAAAGIPGRYTLQAAIAACHATAPAFADTDWTRITALYARLSAGWPSPVVTLNHAVALGMSGEPDRALALLDGLDAALPADPHLPAARGELLALLGRTDQARAAYREAAARTRNEPERALFTGKADAL